MRWRVEKRGEGYVVMQGPIRVCSTDDIKVAKLIAGLPKIIDFAADAMGMLTLMQDNALSDQEIKIKCQRMIDDIKEIMKSPEDTF